MERETVERARVVAAARTWLNTPYLHHAKIKGKAADCVTFVLGVFQEAGLIGDIPLPEYSPQWHLNGDRELYLDALAGRFAEVPQPLPGDLVLWRFGRTFAHGGIVMEWPVVAHALWGNGVGRVILDDAERTTLLTHIGAHQVGAGQPRPRRFFSYWGETRPL